jgi:hypothetical protein
MVLMLNLASYPGDFVLGTVTAPGDDSLPRDALGR